MSRRHIRLSAAMSALAVAAVGTAVAQAVIVQKGTMRMSVDSNLSPKKLPRDDRAPIAVSISWKVGTIDESEPPKLKKLKIEINRNGLLESLGIPICPIDKIQPATTERALANCRPSLVGRGQFSAIVGLEGQEKYVAKGKMVVFNSERGGKPFLYGQIYTAYPFANSFVIPFKVDRIKNGTYGTALTATLPPSLQAWGNLTEISMRLSRKYSYEGRRHSFLSAACPTPEGVPVASFSLARTSFVFSGGIKASTKLSDECRVRH